MAPKKHKHYDHDDFLLRLYLFAILSYFTTAYCQASTENQQHQHLAHFLITITANLYSRCLMLSQTHMFEDRTWCKLSSMNKIH